MPNLTQGDIGYGFKLTLEDENGPVNLTGATVLFLMGSHIIQTIPDDLASGMVIVAFDAIHTAERGTFKAQCQVTYADNSIEHYPSEGYIYVDIQEGVK